MPRPTGRKLAGLLGGKLFFFAWSLALQDGVGTALSSHVRWLKRMGRPEPLAAA